MYKKIKYPNIETCIINKNSAFPMNKKNLVKWLNLELHDDLTRKMFHTGKSFSEVLILASTNNPQYDKRLSIELPVQYMKIPSLKHGENMRRTCCVQKLVFVFVLTFRTTYVNNMLSPCSPMFSPVLSLEFSCNELVIHWTIFCHIVG